MLFSKKIDNIRDLNHLSIGVAGEKTHEALKEYKLTANIKCKVYRTSSMLSAISHIKGDDDIILLVTSSHSYIDKKEYKNPIYQLETYQIERIMRSKKSSKRYIRRVFYRNIFQCMYSTDVIRCS